MSLLRILSRKVHLAAADGAPHLRPWKSARRLACLSANGQTMATVWCILSLACANYGFFASSSSALAQHPDGLAPSRCDRLTSRVSPVMEIEVIDPNRDARGNPAIEITTDPLGRAHVEIPPSLIVHRYYYNGDRSFRGPDLPGGPSIIVAQHPNDGQLVYLPVQMLPGSPVVHYSARSIEYDFGDRAVIVAFPKIGQPTVSYRNGRSVKEKVAHLLGIEKVKSTFSDAKSSMESLKETTVCQGRATGAFLKEAARPITLPAQRLAQLLPGFTPLTDPSLKAQVIEQQALAAKQQEIERAAAAARIRELDIPSGIR